MLFLHQKISIITLLFFLLFYTSSYSLEEKTHTAQIENIESQKSLDSYLMISSILLLGIFVFTGAKLRRIKKDASIKNDQLLHKINSAKKGKLVLDDHFHLVSSLHKSLSLRLNKVLLMLKELKLDVPFEQKELTDELNEIVGYTENCVSAFNRSVFHFNSLE